MKTQIVKMIDRKLKHLYNRIDCDLWEGKEHPNELSQEVKILKELKQEILNTPN